ARHPGGAGDDVAEVEPQPGELLQALARDVRGARDREPVDELVADARRVGDAGAGVLAHVVVRTQVARGAGEWRGEPFEIAAGKAREAREARRRAPDGVARHAAIVVDHDIYEDAVADRPGRAARRARRRPRMREDVAHVRDVGAHGQADTIDETGGHL